MMFTRRPKTSVVKVSAPPAKLVKLTARKDEIARLRLADSDGARRRELQMMEDNRLR
ncbi:hypothetical protein [Aminobacter ciceronei]|jgi:hypothetical protein|uniref:Uncharacterized protein n=1 Tax=Aminobacter ciceronei TaxID=150723 RepID=A0ABR6C0E7_9HYPH|nr:hypothetical protein [Aminobacter ciceronei]MBA8904623.1 hypothetical protein [Aminobacter ciceronei]MBA9018401.1 hypothetical protein [Aminobacter ciceronei]WMC95610.1 hypothetical protein RAR13_19815 [Aminobacter aminovorans]